MKDLNKMPLGELYAMIQRTQDKNRIYRQQITAMQRRIEFLKNLSARQSADLRAFGGELKESELYHELERERARRLTAEAELDSVYLQLYPPAGVFDLFFELEPAEQEPPKELTK